MDKQKIIDEAVNNFSEDLNYLFSKIDFSKSNLDGKAIGIMNTLVRDYKTSLKDVAGLEN